MASAGRRVDEALRREVLVQAHLDSAAVARRTPCLTSASFSSRCGGTIALKAECLQRTGSFKLRGALNKLRAIGEGARGVVAGSAGNHGQALAYAARHAGVRCEVFMPAQAAVSKLAAVRAFGAEVHQRGDSVDQCVEFARERAAAAELTFVHPFDDLDVIVGQAGVGIELIEDVPDLSRIVVPIGGGGLASGVALAVKQARPEVEVVGVQAAAFDAVAASFGRAPTAAPATHTLADGIAVKHPGPTTLPLIEAWLDDVVTVTEEAIAEAMILLLERSKLVVEGAGAISLGALLSGAVAPAGTGSTVAILSGGNVDVGLLASIAAHEETKAGRRARLFTQVPDRPGGLAGLLAAVADTGANLIAVEHVRDGVRLPIRETGVTLTVETRGAEHFQDLLRSLRDAGFQVVETG